MSLFGNRGGADACPPELELTRAISLGPTAALSAHLAACQRCAALSRALARPGELARAAPPPARSAAALEQTRTALLASLAAQRAEGHRTVARGPWLLGLSFAAAAVVLLAWRLVPLGTTTRGRTAEAVAPAALEHAATATASAAAAPPSRGEAAAPAAPREVHHKSVAVKIAAERAVGGPSPAETAFVQAWTAFRAGGFGAAAEGFRDVARLEPTGPLVEDATYWRAVALARTGSPEASAALTDFLRRYPRSAHAHDASLLLERSAAATSPRDPAP